MASAKKSAIQSMQLSGTSNLVESVLTRRRKWSNPEILFNDCGLRIEFLEDKKVELIFKLLEASLSTAGYAKVRDAMRINHFLGELVNAKPILNELSYK
jgi:Protein of unknown function (DUF3500)